MNNLKIEFERDENDRIVRYFSYKISKNSLMSKKEICFTSKSEFIQILEKMGHRYLSEEHLLKIDSYLKIEKINDFEPFFVLFEKYIKNSLV
jgi:hypothetical protein